MMKNMNMDLSKIANGALQEKFSEAFAKVLENLTDPNTPFKDKRNIQCQLTFTRTKHVTMSSVRYRLKRSWLLYSQ